MELGLPERQARNGETIQLAISAKDFVDIVSIQFSLKWNSTIIQYTGFEKGELNQIGIGDVMAPNGELRVSWFDVEGVGIDLDDESAIVYLNFLVTGETGQSTNIEITDQPLDIQIFQGGEGVFNAVELTPRNGMVEIVQGLGVSAEIGQVSCFGESTGSIDITLNGNPDDYTISWTGPEEFSSDQLSLNNLTAGNYQLTISDNDGKILLEETYSITAPLSQISFDEVAATPTGCGESSGQVSFQISGGSPPYQIDIGEGPKDQTQFNGLSAGDYSAIVIDANNCQTTQSFTIEAPEMTPVNLGDDTQICDGESLLLDAGNHQKYTWSTGERTASITVTEPGTYTVTVSDGSACISSDTINLLVVPTIELTTDQNEFTACPDEETTLQISGGTTYEWTDTSNTLTIDDPSAPIANPEVTSRYFVKAENECSSDTTSFLIEVPEITANAGSDTCVAAGATVTLAAEGGVSYQWADGNYTLDDYTIPNPTGASG